MRAFVLRAFSSLRIKVILQKEIFLDLSQFFEIFATGSFSIEVSALLFAYHFLLDALLMRGKALSYDAC